MYGTQAPNLVKNLCNGTKINEYLSSLQKSKITQAQGHNTQQAMNNVTRLFKQPVADINGQTNKR